MAKEAGARAAGAMEAEDEGEELAKAVVAKEAGARAAGAMEAEEEGEELASFSAMQAV